MWLLLCKISEWFPTLWERCNNFNYMGIFLTAGMWVVTLVITPCHISWDLFSVCTTERMWRYLTWFCSILLSSKYSSVLYVLTMYTCIGILLCLESKWWYWMETAYSIWSRALCGCICHDIRYDSKIDQWG